MTIDASDSPDLDCHELPVLVHLHPSPDTPQFVISQRYECVLLSCGFEYIQILGSSVNILLLSTGST